jgi:hypothetical protein
MAGSGNVTKPTYGRTFGKEFSRTFEFYRTTRAPSRTNKQSIKMLPHPLLADIKVKSLIFQSPVELSVLLNCLD